MRRFVTASFLALSVALFAGCSEQETQTPTEPQFKKVSNECAGLLSDELGYIHDDIEDVFMDRQAKRGAHQIVDNIGRKVCQDPPNFDATPIMAEGFYQHVLNVDDFNGGLDAAIDLVERVFAFALGTPEMPLPPEAFEPDGGVGVVSPETPDTIWTNNDEAAIVVDAGSFVGTGPVTIVLTRLSDPDPGTPGSPIPGYQAYPEAYDFFANADLTGFAEVWMCVVTDALPVPFENLVIGHNDDGTARLLTPPLYELEPGDVLDCTGADYQPVIEGLAGTPAWLQFAGMVLEPVVNRLLDVKPLKAMYFAGKGLGGRTGSLSPFAPVDRGVSNLPEVEFVQSTLNVESPPGSGNYINTYDFTTTNWADFPAFLFELTSDYGPCGGNSTPSRTWLEVFDASDDSYIYGFCGFDSPDDLQSYWFATPAGQGPPDTYMELWDRSTDVRYRSNTVVVPAEFNTLTIAATGSGTVTRPITGGFDINCHFTNGLADAGDDCTHTAEEWVMYGGFVIAADAGFAFTGWTGPCTGTGPCVVPMDADKTLTANFSPVAGPVLNLTIPGRLTVTASSGEVLNSCEGGLYGNTCEYVFGAEDVVTLDAVDWPGISLPLWLGVDCNGGDNQLETCTFPMVGNQTVQLVPDTGV
jgi:uncharacterized repeat protein (TIGR02543 family)